ncbi:unnamed protein product [Tenebrio molitor]|nr:unnamed protein product [Tenebrio molitor]
MKDKKEDHVFGVEEQMEIETFTSEFQLQKDRIRNILDEAIYKLRLLTHLPLLMENDGEMLRKFLNKTEADFIVMVCQENLPFSRNMVENRSDLILICNMLERINMYEKRGSASMKKGKSFYGADHYDTHVGYAVDILFKSHSLVQYMETLEETPDSLMTSFIESMIQLKRIVEERLNMSASEEIKRENDLKTAYRSSMMLSDNIQELEEQLEKQRQELGKEHDRKEAILQDLAEKIGKLREKSKKEINRIVYDSEILMMKDYNKSIEKQEELAQDATESTQQYENLLEEHLHKEKSLRAKRLKVETQLASWITKYDTDIGEKQAEYDELEKTYNDEKAEYEALQERFDEQEEEYLVLMKEKEEEEQRINEEKAWIFLQNRAARRIQRAWRAYRARKLARRRAKKSKKKGGSAGGKKGGSAGSKKDKKQEEATTVKGGPDPNALLDTKFNKDIMGEIKSQEAFAQRDVVVDLEN